MMVRFDCSASLAFIVQYNVLALYAGEGPIDNVEMLGAVLCVIVKSLAEETFELTFMESFAYTLTL